MYGGPAEQAPVYHKISGPTAARPFPMATVAELQKQGVLCAQPTQRLVGLDVVLLGRAESHPRCKPITCSILRHLLASRLLSG